MRSIRRLWGRHRGVLFALLAGTVGWVVFQKAYAPRPLATWTEGVDELIAFTPDGSSVLSGDGGMVRLHEARTGRLLWTLTEQAGEGREIFKAGVESPSFSKDGRWLIGMAAGNHLKIWDMATGRERAVFADLAETWGATPTSDLTRIDGNRQDGLDGSPDSYLRDEAGRTLAFPRQAEGEGLHVEVWDVESLTSKATFPNAALLAFSGDGRRVALCESGGNQRLWAPGYASRMRMVIRDVPSGRLTFADDFKWKGAEVPLSASFSPDSATLAVSRRGWLELLDAATGRRRSRFETPGSDFAPWFRPDGRLLFSEGPPLALDFGAPENPPTIHLELAGGSARRVEGLPRTDDSRFSPDGRNYAAIAWNAPGDEKDESPKDPSKGATVRLFDALTGHQGPSIFNQTEPYLTKFSDDGRILALEEGSAPGVLPRLLYRFPRLARFVRQGPSTHDLRLMDSMTGRERGRVHMGAVNRRPILIAFSPRGDLFALKILANPSFLTRPPPFPPRIVEANHARVEVWALPPRRPVWVTAMAAVAMAAFLALGFLADLRRNRARTRPESPRNSREIPPEPR